MFDRMGLFAYQLTKVVPQMLHSSSCNSQVNGAVLLPMCLFGLSNINISACRHFHHVRSYYRVYFFQDECLNRH